MLSGEAATAACSNRDTERPLEHGSEITAAHSEWPFPPQWEWSAITCEHSYFKQWIPLEDSRPNVHENTCFEEAHPHTGLVCEKTRSKRAVMYEGKLLSLCTVYRRSLFGENMLHQAVMQGDNPKIRAILQLNPNVNLTDYGGWTALHEAVVRGNYQACVWLIQSGASVNVAGQNGVTPLHYAVQNRHVQIASFLLKHGADPWLMDHNGETAFSLSDEPALQTLMLQRPQELLRGSRKCPLCPTQDSVPPSSSSSSSFRPESCVSPAALGGRSSPSGGRSVLLLCTQQDSEEASDSDQTINYLSSSNSSEDWSLQDTQKFSGPDFAAFTEDSAWYTFPTESA